MWEHTRQSLRTAEVTAVYSKKSTAKRDTVCWKDSITTRLLLAFGATAFIFLVVNILMFIQINNTIGRIDSVYSSNVSLNQLSAALGNVQDNMLSYLNTRGSDALNEYYRSDQEYTDLISRLNQKTTDSERDLLEENIYNMSNTYLDRTRSTIQAKRGRLIETYKMTYAETAEMYGYINTDITKLNNLLFKKNADSYQALQQTLRYMELFSLGVLTAVAVVMMFILILLIRSITRPLAHLAGTANKVSRGNFDVTLTEPAVQDEVGVVQGAFNGMVRSVNRYIVEQKETMEEKLRMNERELMMEAHLKDAQLKYLQAQINPHFLFNSLNAGAQLALMEDAEKTNVFMEKMADFFRYNVRKMSEDTTLGEEIEAVDNYIYILNVRFAGDIHYTKTIEDGISGFATPCMVLQPVVENAINHGLRDVEGEWKIALGAGKTGDGILITVKDNGIGMTKEQIRAVLNGEKVPDKKNPNSTGTGLDNVIKRLELYYNKDNLLTIKSEGKDKGTTVEMNLPDQK